MPGMKRLKKHKRFALIEDNTIEPLYYGDSDEQRWIELEKGKYYLYHDVLISENGKITSIALMRHQIVKESDNVNLLKKLQKETFEKWQRKK